MNRSKLLISLLILAGGSAAYAQQNHQQDWQYNSRVDLSGGYNLINSNAPPGSCECFTMNGAFVDGAFNFKKWISAAGMVTAGHSTDISALGQNLTLMTYMGGPRARWSHSRLTFFGQFLAGGARGTGSYFPTSTGSKSSATAFAFSTGGGLDFNLSPRLAIRAFNAQYLHTEFPNGSDGTQNELEIGTGIVFRFGGDHSVGAPQMHVPQERSEIEFTCGVSTPDVAAGETVQVIGEIMTLPDKLDVAYSWTTGAGTIQGSGRMVTVDTSHLAPGIYHVDGRASLVSNPSVGSSCQTSFRVREESAAQSNMQSQEIVVPPSNGTSDFYKHIADLFFDYDSSGIRADAQTALSQDVTYLNAHPEINITIAGYADERGSAEYNIALGLKRALDTRSAFTKAGINESRMKVLSYGKEKPFCTEDTESCMQQNRRAQILPDTQ